MKTPKLHWSLRESTSRVIQSVPPILQIVLGATAAFSIAHFLLGHTNPIFAVTVTIASLGFSRDARPKRVLQTAFGMILGIALSEVLLWVIGSGVWQMALVLLICLTAARFINGSAAFALTVGIQAMLVYIMPAPEGGAFIRSLDGLLGGATALLFTALIPRDPRGLAKHDGEALFFVFLDSLKALEIAVRRVDNRVADAALAQMRKSQPLVDNWRLSLDSAIAVSRISPFLRKYRDELSGQVRLMRGMDLATRNLRVVVRRVDFLVDDGKARPYLADLFDQIGSATTMLQRGLEDEQARGDAQEMFVEIIHQLDPKRFGIANEIREASVLLLLRPLLVDLLCASGMTEDAARTELPTI